MSYGVVPTGFKRKTKEEIKASLIERFRLPENFGAGADVEPVSPLGMLIEIFATEKASAWEGAESNYYAHFLDTSTGVNLDRVCRAQGVVRNPATNATAVLRFTGDNGTVIPSGYRVRTRSSIEYRTTEAAIITGGSAEISAVSVLTGYQAAVEGDQLTVMIIPIVGVNTVTNPAASQGGTPQETDTEMRVRLLTKVSINKRDVGALTELRVVMENSGIVRTCQIVENNLSVEWDGMAPNSITIIIDGGTDADIAAMIFKYKSGGIALNGSVVHYITDNFGTTHTIRFERPTPLSIYAKIIVQTKDGWTSDNTALIKTAFVSYIGGLDTVIVGGSPVSTEYPGLRAGEQVMSLALYQSLAAIPGILNATVSLGTVAGDVTHPSVSVAANQIPRTLTANIEVQVL